jgi:protein-S-isoprenylcysteine O-methyltransferase Ste14
MKPHKQTSKHGIGLYTYEQAKNTTPFQYFAQIVVGTIVALLGIMVGISQYQSPTRSTGWLVTSAVAIVIGTFMAHAGVIFWYRRLRKN